METKDELVTTIKTWIDIDNELKELAKVAKELREKKKNVTNNLVDVMKSNEIDCFDLKEGKLVYSETKTKAPLNKKNLVKCLTPYFQNNSELAEQLTNHILDSRDVKVRESIRRKKS
tara:strand:- start:278 stop:628 length:351 start_codon:yes stop_codon:yes gene_type:complete